MSMKERWSRWPTSDIAALTLLLLIVTAFFWPLIAAGYWIPRGGGDLVSFIWPMYRFAARSLRAGVIPLWNPHLHSGAPFVADNQSGVFYPINLAAFMLCGEPSYAMIEALVVFHIWLAAANAFALGRGLGLGRPAAMFGGIAFALSDLFVTHIGNLNLNATAAWLPLLLLCAHRALLAHSVTWAVGAGLTLATAALAGHGQMLLYLALTVGLYLLYRLAADWRLGLRRALRTVGLTALIVAIGVGGAALALLPAYEMAGHTGRGRLSFDDATRFSLPPRALIGLLVPGFYGRGPADFWGGWERVEVGYAGVVTLALAAVGGGAMAHKRKAAGGYPLGFFALLTPLAFLLALGPHTPLYGLLYRYAPTFDQVRAPARLILLGDLGLAMLGAYGLERLARGQAGRWARIVGLGALIAAGATLAIGLPRAQMIPPPDRVSQAVTSIVAAAALLALSGVYIWFQATAREKRARWMAWLALALLSADLIWLGSTLEIEPNDPRQGFAHADIVEFLHQDGGLYRIESAASAWQPDAALAHGLYDVGGVYNPLGLAPYQAYRWAVGERAAPLYNLMGVKYVLADKGQPPGDERLVPVFTANTEIDVYLNTEALPRVLLVYRSQIAPEHAAAWQAIHDPAFDPARTVVLEEGDPLDVGPGDGERHIAFTRYESNVVELTVRTPVTGYVVLSDVYYPGWRATMNGQPTELLRADYVFRAVQAPPGEHTVRMTFAPWTWRVGWPISLITWLAVGVWVVWRRRMRSPVSR